jgi:hypothetical protein
MGLLDSGGKGNSRARTTSSSTTNNETTNFVDNSVHTSDFGAVQAGTDVATRALEENSEVARASIGAGRDLAGSAFDTARDINDDSLKLLGGLVDKSIDASKTYARDSAEGFKGALTTALGGYEKLAVQNSASSDDRVTKVAGLALLAVAAVLILPALFKGGGRAVVA